jgi:hypothetical protein
MTRTIVNGKFLLKKYIDEEPYKSFRTAEIPNDNVIIVDEGLWQGWHIKPNDVVGPVYDFGDPMWVETRTDKQWTMKIFHGYVLSKDGSIQAMDQIGAIWKATYTLAEIQGFIHDKTARATITIDDRDYSCNVDTKEG